MWNWSYKSFADAREWICNPMHVYLQQVVGELRKVWRRDPGPCWGGGQACRQPHLQFW